MYKGEIEQDMVMGLLYYIYVLFNFFIYKVLIYKLDIYIILNCSRIFSDFINMIKCFIKLYDQIISLKYFKLYIS